MLILYYFLYESKTSVHIRIHIPEIHHDTHSVNHVVKDQSHGHGHSYGGSSSSIPADVIGAIIGGGSSGPHFSSGSHYSSGSGYGGSSYGGSSHGGSSHGGGGGSSSLSPGNVNIHFKFEARIWRMLFKSFTFSILFWWI